MDWKGGGKMQEGGGPHTLEGPRDRGQQRWNQWPVSQVTGVPPPSSCSCADHVLASLWILRTSSMKSWVFLWFSASSKHHWWETLLGSSKPSDTGNSSPVNISPSSLLWLKPSRSIWETDTKWATWTQSWNQPGWGQLKSSLLSSIFHELEDCVSFSKLSFLFWDNSGFTLL